MPTPVKIALPVAALVAVELDDDAALELPAPVGMPGWAAFGGGTPIGGGALGFWARARS